MKWRRFLYGIIIMLFKPYILPTVGTDQNTFSFCYQYLFWTITIGAVPTVLNAALSHLVRAEGYSTQASLGVALGGGLNIILDPVFNFAFKMEIEGAAVATMLSNLIAMLYFIALILKKRQTLHITFDPLGYTLGSHIRQRYCWLDCRAVQ